MSTALLIACMAWIVPASAEAASPPPPIKLRAFQGEGDDVVRVSATKLRGIATIKHTGEANFAVWSIEPSGKNSDLLVNHIGDYSGTVVVNIYPWMKSGGFKIEADGAWTLKFAPISYAPLWKPLTVKNVGDKVLKLAQPTKGFHTLRYAHSGESNFAVFAIPVSGSAELLVNKIGRVSGKVTIPSGTKYVWVQADGKWTLTRK
ncbi:hypothetical protein [Microbispora sp. NPDC046933]|uniref:hypothetical protein n=1 Tax=Microbispora sp. NPDC046933 TaxID=3155618 RepID=UPI0033C299D3